MGIALRTIRESMILVAVDLPLTLAKTIEQALILLRENPGKNILVPFWQQIGMTHKELRVLASKLLIRAFRQKIELKKKTPENELASKHKRPNP